MLQNHIAGKISEHLGFEPTQSQHLCIAELSNFLTSHKNHATFLLKGFAGTGKTTMVNAIVKTLDSYNLKYSLLAPTGRAAKVMSSYTSKPAFTIHKKIYRQKTSGFDQGGFSLGFNSSKETVFIVDEASMISDGKQSSDFFGSGNLLADLIKYVFSAERCKLILIGDVAQLPPVGLENSPALDKKNLEYYGLNITDVLLNNVMRQAEGSGILYNATNIRKLVEANTAIIPKFELNDFPDIEYVTGNELIEKIAETYDKYGADDTIIITRSNQRANKFNMGIRNSILWRESELETGDLLMVVKNNYFWLNGDETIPFIANGDIIRVLRIHKVYEQYGFRFADLTLEFADYENREVTAKVLLDTLSSESPALTREEQNKLYNNVLQDYAHLTSKKERFDKMRIDPFFNALQIKYSYAITCHKAQGGQWSAAFLDQGYFTKEMISVEYLRWLYTGFTRPVKKLFLVNFHKSFFHNSDSLFS